MKCNDCGNIFESIKRLGGRSNICAPCWDTRMNLVAGKIVPLGSPMFKEIQRKMATGRGTAKRFIESLKEVGK